MKKKALHNPTKAPIIDYKIEEYDLDLDDNPQIDSTTGQPKHTGKTLLWTIDAGETVVFPAYVADVLREIYGFLVESAVGDEKLEEATVESNEAKED